MIRESATDRLIPPTDHGPHTEAHAFITVNQIAEVLARRGHGNTFLVS